MYKDYIDLRGDSFYVYNMIHNEYDSTTKNIFFSKFSVHSHLKLRGQNSNLKKSHLENLLSY